MRYLLDTCMFIYMMDEQDVISRDVDAILTDYDSVLCMSVESLRELIVAYRKKKLLSKKWHSEGDLIRGILDSRIVLLPLKPEHMLTYSQLRLKDDHDDPSDHVIIAQAITENIPLISSDTRFPFYCAQGLELIFNEK